MCFQHREGPKSFPSPLLPSFSLLFPPLHYPPISFPPLPLPSFSFPLDVHFEGKGTRHSRCTVSNNRNWLLLTFYEKVFQQLTSSFCSRCYGERFGGLNQKLFYFSLYDSYSLRIIHIAFILQSHYCEGPSHRGPSQLIYCEGPDLRTLTGSTPTENQTANFNIFNRPLLIFACWPPHLEKWGVQKIFGRCTPTLKSVAPPL